MTPCQSKGQQSAKASRQSLATTTRDQEGKETMGQAPPTGTTSWYGGKPCVPELSRSGPHLVCVFSVPVSLHKQHGVTSRVLLSHSARKVAQPREVHVELRPPGSSVSLGLSLSPLWLSVCPSSAVHRAKRGREEVRIGPQCPSARWHPGGQSLVGLLERGTRHSEHPPHPPPRPGGVDLSPDGGGLRDGRGEKSSTAPKKPGTCQWCGAVRLCREDKGGQAQRGPWLPPLREEAGP